MQLVPLITNYFINNDNKLLDYIHVLKNLEILGLVSPRLSKEILSDIRDYYEDSLHLSPLYVDSDAIVSEPNTILVNKYKKLLTPCMVKIIDNKGEIVYNVL